MKEVKLPAEFVKNIVNEVKKELGLRDNIVIKELNISMKVGKVPVVKLTLGVVGK